MLVNVEADSTDESNGSATKIHEDEDRSNRTEKRCLTVTNIPVGVFTSERVKVNNAYFCSFGLHTRNCVVIT